MRRRLYLLRHGAVAYFGPDGPAAPEGVPLTDAGRAQAEAARDALAAVPFDRVIASDLPRTIETARLVAPGHEPEPWPELREWRGGRLADLPEEGLEREFTGALRPAAEDVRFLGGETLGQLLDRVLPALERLLALEWETALAVLHGGVNRALISHALAGGRAFFGGIEQPPACINVLDVDAEGWLVRTVGYVPYAAVDPARSTTMEELWAEYRQFS